MPNKEAISLFYRHQDYFTIALALYYPFTETELVQYSDLLNWHNLSQNKNINWTTPMVKRFADELHWSIFSKNGFFADERQIERFIGLVDWGLDERVYNCSIMNNPFIRWDEALIKKYRDKINIAVLSTSEQVVWTSKLIDCYLKEWNWAELSINESLPWSLEFFRRYFTFWQLDSSSFRCNRGIISCVQIVEAFWDLFYPGSIFSNEKLPWLEMDLLEKWKHKINWGGLASNTTLQRQPGFFHQHLHQWQKHNLFPILSYNEALPWSVSLFERYLDLWDMESISTNPGLPWSEEFIARYEDYLPWGRIENIPPIPDEDDELGEIIESFTIELGLVDNEALPWSLNFILKNEQKIDFRSLEINHSAWEKSFKPIVDKELLSLVFRMI